MKYKTYLLASRSAENSTVGGAFVTLLSSVVDWAKRRLRLSKAEKFYATTHFLLACTQSQE